MAEKKDRVILHADFNNFYASVECMLNPKLKGHPVVVGGDVEARHGIILSKNMEAKKFGIQTGEALWQAKQKCPNLVIVPPHYEEYIKYSRLARKIYEEYTDLIQPYRMDENWLDVTGSTGLFGDGETIANTLRERMKFELGLSISVGVSFNMIFAKLGSDMKKPDAVTIIPKDTFIIAMNLITEHNAQLRRMMDLANTIGSNLLLISTGSFFHDAISLVFKESFRDTDKLLDWWLYESYDQELYLGEQKFDASDPGNFYDFLVKYRQDWKKQRQCNAPPQKPVQISKDCFRKAIALVRKEQNSLRTVEDAAHECSSIFNVHGNTSKYLDALILLLQDLFGDTKGVIRWYITKPIDHKVFIGDTMYDLNDPCALYDFMLTHTTELKCVPSFL